jgi:hypothetical protein
VDNPVDNLFSIGAKLSVFGESWWLCGKQRNLPRGFPHLIRVRFIKKNGLLS